MTEDDLDKLPSRRAEIQGKTLKEKKEKSREAEEMMRHDFAMTFGTETGQRVLAWMMERSDFGKVILAADKNNCVDPMATTYNAMELNWYLAIRKHIPIDILTRVEYGLVKPSGTIENQSSQRTTSKDTSERT